MDGVAIISNSYGFLDVFVWLLKNLSVDTLYECITSSTYFIFILFSLPKFDMNILVAMERKETRQFERHKKQASFPGQVANWQWITTTATF